MLPLAAANQAKTIRGIKYAGISRADVVVELRYRRALCQAATGENQPIHHCSNVTFCCASRLA